MNELRVSALELEFVGKCAFAISRIEIILVQRSVLPSSPFFSTRLATLEESENVPKVRCEEAFYVEVARVNRLAEIDHVDALVEVKNVVLREVGVDERGCGAVGGAE